MDATLDLIYSLIDGYLRMHNFRVLQDCLDGLPYHKMPVDILLGLLTITASVSKHPALIELRQKMADCVSDKELLKGLI